jgi:hypothetical protein
MVGLPPLLNHDACLHTMTAPFQVETFIAQFAIEAFVRPILPRFPRIDIRCLHPTVCQPRLDRLRDKFWPMVAAQKPGSSMVLEELLQNGDHLGRRHPCFNLQGQVFTAPFINHREDLQLLPIRTRIVDEIIRPDMKLSSYFAASRTFVTLESSIHALVVLIAPLHDGDDETGLTPCVSPFQGHKTGLLCVRYTPP